MRKQPLRFKVILLFVATALVIVGLYALALRGFLNRYARKGLDSEYEAILAIASDTMDKLLWNLTLTSQQLVSNGDIQDALHIYASCTDTINKQSSYNKLLEAVSMLTMSNTDIALIYFYDNTAQTYLYANLPVSHKALTNPLLYQSGEYSFRGPGPCQCNVLGKPVLDTSSPTGKSSRRKDWNPAEQFYRHRAALYRSQLKRVL